MSKEFQATPTLDEIRQMAAQSNGTTQPTSKPVGIIDPAKNLTGVGSAYQQQTPPESPKRLSPATEEGLAALQREREYERKKKEDEEAKRKAEADKAEAEARVLANLGGFDYDTFRSLVVDNPFLSKDLKESIESSLEPIALKDLILGRGQQIVEIVRGELAVIFQTLKGREDLLIKRIMRSDADQLGVYFEDKKAILTLCIGLEAINGQLMPALEDPAESGATSEATLLRRFNALLELPIQLIAFLAVNYNWFDLRVKRTLTPQNLKNG